MPKTVQYLSGEEAVGGTIWLGGVDCIMGSTHHAGDKYAAAIPHPTGP